MTILDVRFAVNNGRCTWLQVYETLINAGTSHETRRLVLAGEIEIAVPVGHFLERLFVSGAVPTLPL